MTRLIPWLILITLTACTGSSAATQPPQPRLPSPTPAPPTADLLQPGKPATPTRPPATATPTVTSTPTPRPPATPSPTPSPWPTPVPALRQLTSGGCCVQPFFSPDGGQVLFIDRPSPDAPTGIYGVSLADPQPTPVLVNRVIGFRSPDRTVVGTLAGNLVRFTNELTGESWTVDTGGNWPYYSPDGQRIIWSARDKEGPYDRRQSDIWLANLDGSAPRRLASLFGGGFAGWFPNGDRILLVGRDTPDEEEVTLRVLHLASGKQVDLFRHRRLRGIELSPGGSWVVFYVTFADKPADNGIWVVSTDGLTRKKLDPPGFGAYRWRDDQRLYFIPMRAAADQSMRLWSVDVTTGQFIPLTDPAVTSFSVANGDWDVSPDGCRIVFVSSADQNIWLLEVGD